MPIYFSRLIKALLFARLVVRTISTYRKSGRLFILRVMAIFADWPPVLHIYLPKAEPSTRMVSVKDTNPPIAEDFNPGNGEISGRYSAHECAMNVLLFLGHLLLSTLGVAVAAAVLTYSVVLSLHPFFPSLNSRTVHWILTETPYFPVQI